VVLRYPGLVSVHLTETRADEHIARYVAREWGRMN
jgi:hypothetical protein